MKSLNTLRTEVESYLLEWKAVVEEKSRALSKAPEGNLRISVNKGHPRFFHVTNSGDTNGAYMSADQMKLIMKLAQKDYDRTLLAAVQPTIAAAESFLKKTASADVDGVYQKLRSERRKLVKPIRLEDDVYAEQWLAVKYCRKGFLKDEVELCTSKGLRVRSKSEVIIATILDEFNVPYRYEYPQKLGELGVVHPDFLCLNKQTRSELIWEHFGMMDVPEYAEKAVNKINHYERSGYHLGVNFIATMETSRNPLNPRTLKKLVQRMLL